MSSSKTVNWQNLLLNPPPTAPRHAAGGCGALANVDENVAGAALLGALNAALRRRRRVFLALPRLDGAEELFRQLGMWKEMLHLPWRIELLSEIQRGKFYIAGGEADRARVLGLVGRGEFDILVATLPALLAPAPRPETLAESEIILQPGLKYPFNDLLQALVKLDYDDEFEVGSPGEFARRGGIVDVFSPAEERPGRIEFFGDEIESIRAFDPETQRSLPGTLAGYRIIDRCTAQSLTAETGETAADAGNGLDFFHPDSMEFWSLYPGQYPEYFQRFGGETEAAVFDEFIRALPAAARFTVYGATEPAPDGIPACGVYPATAHLDGPLPEEAADRGRELLAEQWRLQFRQWCDTGYTVILAGSDPESPRRLREYFTANHLEDLPVRFEQCSVPGGLLDFAGHFVVVTENELFAGGAAAKREVKTTRANPLSERELKLENTVIADLDVGDYAVHAAHGIGIFRGLATERNRDGEAKEVMVLEYADNAILHVPLHQAGSVSRYIGGGKGSNVKLHRLGGIKWNNDKLATTEAVHQYAAEMLRLQAVRAAAPGLELGGHELAEREFAARFKFTETPDQLRSISEIGDDLASGKPMDRLLCGDVGYGKTEIAMRAAFKLVEAGFQVAVMAPTTVLAQQHYYSFMERFAGYPYTIDMLSRFRSPAEQQTVIAQLASGGVDIVIGTHRLAQSDIHFKNLGLVVVDEEQRFGVKVKDRLLRMRADVNVLTMSATPIPRTLYLSMAGARQLSTIMTAPSQRLPVKTIVMREDDGALAQAINDEIARGGQVYFLHNRVKTIQERCDRLSQLLPAVRFGVAHGQMPEEELEEVMRRFIEGEIQVLVCTTIIESGLDMPNANTIIIERADRFGLAELYQLRGRVGRWKHQAYAYLVVPEHAFITADGRKRIAAIRRYTQLGAGLRLALRDLEIRGAGNLLGAEQSGHINAVGFELYCQLLSHEIAMLKHEQHREWLPDVDISIEFVRCAFRAPRGCLAAALPPDYIDADRLRIEAYRRIGRLVNENEVEDFRRELRDRYGKLPEAAENLLSLTLIRIFAARAGFRGLSVTDGRVYLRNRASDSYRVNGKIPWLPFEKPAAVQLRELLRIVRMAALEKGAIPASSE